MKDFCQLLVWPVTTKSVQVALDQQAGSLLAGEESEAWGYRVCADGLVTCEWGIEAGQLSLMVTQRELVSL